MTTSSMKGVRREPMFKDWNFDEIIDRTGTASMKWEPGVLSAVFGEGKEDLLPLWVADMDFKCPTVVRRAMEQRLAHQIYGYSLVDPAYAPALISWYKRRHQWEIDEEWILTTPGIVPAAHYIVQRFTQPGDKVLIQPPVYYPFNRAIENSGRRILENPLRIGPLQLRLEYTVCQRLKRPVLSVSTKPASIRFHGPQRLLERLLEGPADTHALPYSLHLRG